MGTKRHRIRGVVAAVLVGGTLTACGGDSTGTPTRADTAAAQEPANDAAADTADTADDAADEAPGGADSAGTGDLENIEDIDGAATAAESNLGGDVAGTANRAGARIVIDGQTYDFRVVDAETGTLAYSYCLLLVGTLQGMMQLVDEQGQGIEGGELEFYLPGSGSIAEQEGDVPEFYFAVPETESSPVWSHYTLAEIDAPIDGPSVSGGTFTLQEFRGPATVSGTVDISC